METVDASDEQNPEATELAAGSEAEACIDGSGLLDEQPEPKPTSSKTTSKKKPAAAPSAMTDEGHKF